MTSTVYIAKNVYGGDGLGRLGDGRVVFVPDAWAGEQVKAEKGDVIVAKSRGKWITTGDPKNYFMAHLEYVLSETDYGDEVRKFVAEN